MPVFEIDEVAAYQIEAEDEDEALERFLEMDSDERDSHCVEVTSRDVYELAPSEVEI